MPRRSILLAGLAVVAALLAGAVVILWQTDGERQSATRSGQVRTTGQADIGGEFTLVDRNGNTRTAQDYRGSYMLVFFGYTHCPDFCPTALTAISAAMDQMGDAAQKVQPLFISIDPARDTPEALDSYSGSFHPRIDYLTGSDEQVARAARAYRVYYARRDIEGSYGKAYLMDHSTFTYLMAPDGSFITFFEHGIAPSELAERVREHVRAGGTN